MQQQYIINKIKQIKLVMFQLNKLNQQTNVQYRKFEMFKKKQLNQETKPQIFNSQYQIPHSNPQTTQRNNLNDPVQTNNNSINYPTQQTVDMRRLRRAIFQFQGSQNQEQEQQPERKQAVKMNVFRQSARQQQRQFHQQNHQYLRMFSVIAHSATSTDKFRIRQHRDGNQSGKNQGQNKTSKSSQNYATVHLQLQMQLTSSLINYKFPVKDIYNIVPFKRQSIQFQSRELLDPRYQFFVFEKCSPKVQEIRGQLRNILEEGLASEFKGSVMRTVGNLNYFEFLDLTNYRQWNSKSNAIVYPKQIIQIAEQAEVFELNSDQQQFYVKGQILIKDNKTNQRLVTCEQFDLSQTAPSVYFQIAEQYALYKKYRQVEFKKSKIYDKDISINTDIRNIISSQKIYLIQLVKQIDLYIDLSFHQTDINIMKQIYKQLKRKCQQFLKVLCNYTQSKILKHYNIQNYHQKIMMFIQKSIKYNKQIQNVNKELLDEFPILRIWYQIPQVLFGYSREKLHKKYYDLVKSLLQYQQRIKDLDLQRKLSIRRPGVTYPQ